MAKSYPVFGEKIVAARDRRGLTQEMLAARASISRSTIASYEAQRVAVASPKVLQALAQAIGLSFPDLLKEIGAPPEMRPQRVPRPLPDEAIVLGGDTLKLIEPFATAARQSIGDYVDRVLRAHVEQERAKPARISGGKHRATGTPDTRRQ